MISMRAIAAAIGCALRRESACEEPAVSSIPRRAVFAPPSVAARTSRWLIPLAVGGALLLGWLLIRALSGREPRRKSTPKHRPQAIPLGQPGLRWAT
jgi:hypothetical protein